MKILYIDLNVHYNNPTRNLIPILLKFIGETYFYGPGYQPEYVLKKGIKNFYDKNAPFDFIVTNEHIIFSTKKIDKYKNILFESYKRNYFFQFRENLFTKFFKESYNFFKDCRHNRLIFMLESDYYNFEKFQIEILKEIDSYIIGFGNTLISSKEELENLHKEKIFNLVNDNWYNFVKGNNKIIELPHFVGENEFYFNCIHDRKFDISVPGVSYYYRKKVFELIRKNRKEFSFFKNNWWNTIYSIARKIGLRPDGNPISMRFYNVFFKTQLEKTKYVFTCGSALNWPLRKFFEIPAAGALLIAKPFKNAHHFGFIDKETYLKAEIDNILNIIEWANRNEKKSSKNCYERPEYGMEPSFITCKEFTIKKGFAKNSRKKFNKCYWKKGGVYS